MSIRDQERRTSKRFKRTFLWVEKHPFSFVMLREFIESMGGTMIMSSHTLEEGQPIQFCNYSIEFLLPVNMEDIPEEVEVSGTQKTIIGRNTINRQNPKCPKCGSINVIDLDTDDEAKTAPQGVAYFGCLDCEHSWETELTAADWSFLLPREE